ncbi:hypothetical protein BCV70DRAFT_201828 [Testicularia cyperi]|uniref:Uncharacterized protein n=1 Tax=Testicularia cyperi TaxID=1882483 RepID=A0A317XMC0_9BASI|nr:hypothetical protein BCV70DRAFT_201828 [Testicularia cyperi]
MALDAALFTLHFVRRRQQPWIVDLYPSPSASALTPAPPVPSKDDHDSSSPSTGASGSGSNKPVPFTGTIPDVAAQRARALETLDFGSQTPLYTRIRATNAASYSTILIDGLIQDCLLASIHESTTSAKRRRVHLFNPDSELDLDKKTMTFQQAYRFMFCGEEFSWRKESSRGKHASYQCEVIRKPDPSVLAAQYRPPPQKGRPATMQFMDYNLDRLGIDDKKGLEVALIMTLSALLDQEHDERLAGTGDPNMYICTNGLPTDISMLGNSSAWHEAEERWNADSVAVPGANVDQPQRQASGASSELAADLADLEPNEMVVSKWGSVEEYTEHAIRLLRSDGAGQSMYLIVLRSDSSETTPKTIQVAAAIKAAYYRLPDDAKGTIYGRGPDRSVEEELYQYVQTLDDASRPPSSPSTSSEAVASQTKKRIIKLDGPSSSSHASSSSTPSPSGANTSSPSSSAKPKSYTPPSKLKVILSKERIGDLEPKKLDDPYPASFATGPKPVGSAAGSMAGNADTSRLNVPYKPRLPSRPHSPAAPAGSTTSNPTVGNGSSPSTSLQSGSNQSKGKAFLSKLGLH